MEDIPDEAGAIQLYQRVEVMGLKEEGFPDSYSTGWVSQLQAGTISVTFDDFVDDSGVPLVETVDAWRVRPALPSDVYYKQWEQCQLGSAVEYMDSDVWWMGVIVYIAPAGVQITFPALDNVTMFCKGLRRLRPSYQWTGSSWLRTVVRPEALRKLKMPELKLVDPFPATAPHTPDFHQAAADGAAAQAPPASRGGSKPGRLGKLGAPGTLTAHVTNGFQQQQLQQQQQVNGADAQDDEDEEEDDDAVQENGRAAMDAEGPAAPVAERSSKRIQKRRQARQEEEEEEEQQQQAARNGALFVDSDDEYERKKRSDDDDDDSDEETRAQRRKWEKQASDGPVRRSERTPKQRIVYVDGKPVLKQNMYDLNSGEPSVFDSELNKRASSLPRNASLEAPQRQNSAKARGPKPVANKRTMSPAKQQRQRHNDSVRADTHALELKRAAHLCQHLDKLRPFMTPQAEASIKSKAARAPKGALNLPDPPAAQPANIKAALREYQLEGLAWLMAQHDRGLNAILADEMGLGKTLQTITFLAHLKWERNVQGPHLVVVPLSVLASWLGELRRWCPELRVVRLHAADPDERKRLRKEVLSDPNSFDVAVTTYDMVVSQHFGSVLKGTLAWRYLILDEGHKIKNEATLVCQGMRQITRQYVLLLTGTPLQNNMHELFVLLNFMYPDVFTDASLFDSAFDLAKQQVDDSRLAAAHYLLRPFCLRRLKEEVEQKLPAKVETRIACPLSEYQTFWYRRLLIRDAAALQAMEAEAANQGKDTGAAAAAAAAAAANDDEGGGSGANAWRKLMNLVMQLRKVSNHPFMFPDSEPDGDGNSSLEQLLQASGKLQVLDRLLDKLLARGHRVVLFSQFTTMLGILQEYCDHKGFKYRRLDGSTNRIQRMIDIEQFNKPGSDTFVYLLATRAGGLGVNLQTADTCILFDSDWNPQWDLQAMARVHRIGQTRPVHIYRLCTEGTVEERIQKRADGKLYLDQMVNRGSTAQAEELEGLTKGELMSMLTFGADRIFANKEGKGPTDAELDAIIDRSDRFAAVAETVGKDVAAKVDQNGAGPSSSNAVAPNHVGGVKLEGVKVEGNGVQAEAEVEVADGGTVEVKLEGSGAPAAAAAAADAASPSEADGKKVAVHFKSEKHTAADFDAVQAPLSTYILQGEDLSRWKGASLRDIARSFWDSKKGHTGEEEEGEEEPAPPPKRERKSNLVLMGRDKVLKKNNYSMEQGGISAWDQTSGRKAAVEPPKGTKRRMQMAGRDYPHNDVCQVCWDGGELVCCDRCPCAYHAGCLGTTQEALSAARMWSCPHHYCATCGRGTQQAGGLLFRCEVCEVALCEDHLTPDHVMIGECDLFKALGQAPPKQACFILCSQECVDLKERLQPTIKDIASRLADAHVSDMLRAKPKARRAKSTPPGQAMVAQQQQQQQQQVPQQQVAQQQMAQQQMAQQMFSQQHAHQQHAHQQQLQQPTQEQLLQLLQQAVRGGALGAQMPLQ